MCVCVFFFFFFFFPKTGKGERGGGGERGEIASDPYHSQYNSRIIITCNQGTEAGGRSQARKSQQLTGTLLY